MSKGVYRRIAREQKYTSLAASKPMIGMRGIVREVYPDFRPTKHGKPVEKPEREDRWQ